ncbi:MAG: hypothetical protein LUI12_02015 [Clostridiales bacterium]|nr:hypothetical protein [Clostridiales bacterium]
MHVKRIHEMIEKLTECAKSEMDSGMANVDTAEMGAVVDMIKDLCCAEKDAKITKAMEETEEEEKKSDEYFLHMLKEEYGEDEGKRYYDNYRYANGRFAPKGRGTYHSRSSRRGYEEMPYLHMMEESPEWYRDMDRMPMGRMYYSGGGTGGNSSGGQSSGGSSSGGATGVSAGGSSGGSGGSSMGYSESMRGYSDGQSRGYDEGYSRGYREGRSSGGRNRNESRSERARRGYEESKNNHSSNSAEDKQSKMASLEEYMKELSGDLTDMVKDMTPEERTLMKNKINVLATKI